MPGRLSAGDFGLLGIAERRGCVAAPRVVDLRNDPTGVARLELLRRLAERGLLRERAAGETANPDMAEFEITDAGREALDSH